VIFERFSRGGSRLHRADARIKLLGGACLLVAMALVDSFMAALVGLVVGLALVALAALPLRSVLLRLLLVNTFVAFLWLTLPLTYPGQALTTLGPLTISKQGLSLALLITIKTNALLLCTITLFATSSVADLGRAMEQLGLPTKLSQLLLYTYRYIFVINQEYHRLARAARLRCFRPGTNVHSYRTYGYLFGMTLVKSWQRAERVREAMLLRGYHGRFYSLNEKGINSSDLIMCTVLFSIAVGLVGLDLFCQV
jgi:cobalt/nickel transport system permease protein